MPFLACTRRLCQSSSSTLLHRPVCVFLNASRLDYDQKLDFSRLHKLTHFVRNDDEHSLFHSTTDTSTKRLLQDAEIVITKEMEITPSTLQNAFPPSVRLLCEAGTGYNNLPITAARERKIAVCNVPTYSTDAVAHMAITYLMNLSIDMFAQQRMLQSGDKSNFTGPFQCSLQELTNKTLGLVGGSGLIGSRVCDIALQLGMNVIISSRSGKLPVTHRHEGHSRVRVVSDINLLLQESDFVSIHCPLNDETRGSIGRSQLEQMKASAYLINTSRGAICNEQELIDCLEENVIAGAGLDVTESEPPAEDSKLWTLPNVALTPHIGWRRIETRQRLVDMTADNIEAYIKAKSEADYTNVVN